jgi:hypothetical protein
MREEVVLARTDQGDGLTRVMVEHVIVSKIACHKLYSLNTVRLKNQKKIKEH